MFRTFLHLFCLCAVSLFILEVTCGRRHHHRHIKEHRPNLYLNEFAVKINGNNEVASAIAKRNGFINLGQVS